MERDKNAPNGSLTDLNIVLRVKEKREEAADYLSVFFERPRELTFEPGDWMDLRFFSADLAIGKTFSFSSAPTEPDLRITFKKGFTKFKKALENVQVNETLLITQYGSNGFLLDKRFSSVFIAGGVGIAPFRSMLKAAVDYNEKLDITLIYLHRTADFPFKAELDAWQSDCPNLKTHYVVSSREGRLTKEKLQVYMTDRVEPMYYIAGPPGMVRSSVQLLRQLGAAQEAIKTDSFDGYE